MKRACVNPQINRRQFVALGAAGAALAASGHTAAAAAAASNAASETTAIKPPIVRLDLLTSREVGEWRKTNDVIFVPHGPISGHGPWTTLGMHAHGAEAVATLMARARRGLKSGEDQNPEIRDAVRTLHARGSRGFRYDSEREHSSHGTVGLTWRGQPNIELGLKILEGLADYLMPAVEALKKHRDYLKEHPARHIEKQSPLEP